MGFRFVEPGIELMCVWTSELWRGMGRLVGIVCAVPEGDKYYQQEHLS